MRSAPYQPRGEGGATASDAGGAHDVGMRSDGPTSTDATSVEGGGSPDVRTDAPMDALVDAPDDSAAVDAVPPVPGNYVVCGNQTCVPPQGCCLTTTTCTDPLTCSGTFMACDDPTECTGGSICCASVHSNGMRAS